MQNQGVFTIYVLFSQERGPGTLDEPLTFTKEQEARLTYASFPAGKVTLRKDTCLPNGSIVHEVLTSTVEVAPVGVLGYLPGKELFSSSHYDGDIVSVIHHPTLVKAVPTHDQEEAFLEGCLQNFERSRVLGAFLEALEQSGQDFHPQEFFPDGSFGHLRRELTSAEQKIIQSFQREEARLHHTWLQTHLPDLSDDQLVRTWAFHADKDLAGPCWDHFRAALRAMFQDLVG